MTKKVKKVTDEMVKVKVMKDFEGYKKGEEIEVPKRKVRDSSRILKRGYIKPIK